MHGLAARAVAHPPSVLLGLRTGNPRHAAFHADFEAFNWWLGHRHLASLIATRLRMDTQQAQYHGFADAELLLGCGLEQLESRSQVLDIR